MSAANSMSILKGWGECRAVIVRFRAFVPYALMELVLPGGLVMALLLWLYRRRKSGVGFGPISIAAVMEAIKRRWQRPLSTGSSILFVRHFEAGATTGPHRYMTPVLNS
jgi:hypothetical protein